MRQAVSEAGVQPAEIRGIGFDATCSLVVLDRNAQPLPVSHPNACTVYSSLYYRPFIHIDNPLKIQVSPPVAGEKEKEPYDIILWMDHRARAETEAINRTGHDVLDFVGGKMSPEMQVRARPVTVRGHTKLCSSFFSAKPATDGQAEVAQDPHAGYLGSRWILFRPARLSDLSRHGISVPQLVFSGLQMDICLRRAKPSASKAAAMNDEQNQADGQQNSFRLAHSQQGFDPTFLSTIGLEDLLENDGAKVCLTLFPLSIMRNSQLIVRRAESFPCSLPRSSAGCPPSAGARHARSSRTLCSRR